VCGFGFIQTTEKAQFAGLTGTGIHLFQGRQRFVALTSIAGTITSEAPLLSRHNGEGTRDHRQYLRT
jgi:hypothetical protein